MSSSSFRKVVISNLLMFISIYMLFPVLPVVMAERLDLSLAFTGMIIPVITLGMIVAGPFVNYLLDTYRRKNLCILSIVIMLVMTVAYYMVSNPVQLMLVSFIQGVCYGIASSALLTLSIDVTNSADRTKANLMFGRYTRLGMITGLALSGLLFFNTQGGLLLFNLGWRILWITSFVTGVLSIILLVMVHVPFRAPIGMKLISCDRFFMPRAWIIVLNVIMLSFVLGILLPFVHLNISDVGMFRQWIIPYISVLFVGFILYFPLYKYHSVTENIKQRIIIALSFVLISVVLLLLFDSPVTYIVSALFMGVGISISTVPFLLMFIELSNHCERSTANSSHLISWQIGIAAGIALSCYLKANMATETTLFRICLFTAALSLIFFIAVTFPYYLKKKMR